MQIENIFSYDTLRVIIGFYVMLFDVAWELMASVSLSFIDLPKALRNSDCMMRMILMGSLSCICSAFLNANGYAGMIEKICDIMTFQNI